MGLRLNIVGISEARAELERFSDLIDDYEPLWDRYIEIMTEVEAAWFATEGDGSWAPLAQSTQKRKPTRYYKSRGERGPFPLDPLIATGRLLNELTDPEQAARIEQGRTSLGTFDVSALSWGTDDEVAAYHQDGRTGSNPMPKRQVIEWPISPSTRARLEEANRDFVEQRLREAGIKKD